MQDAWDVPCFTIPFHVHHAKDLQSMSTLDRGGVEIPACAALRCVYTCGRNAGAVAIVHPMFYLSTLCTSL